MRPVPGTTDDRLILERDHVLDEIDNALRSAIAGDGSTFLLVGNAGVGKTHVVEAVADRAVAAGAAVLRARGTETERDFSFGIVLQLLQRRVLTADSDERDQLLAGAAGLAKPLLDGTQLQNASGPEAAFATHHGLFWLVSNLSDLSPQLLIVDDAQWADVSSLQFLATLANRIDGLAAMILIVRRLGESNAGDEFIDTISLAPSTSVIRLDPLSDRAIGSLVRAWYAPNPSDAFDAACARAVQGNPLYLRELVNELRANGIAPDDAGSLHVANVGPETLARSVGARLGRAGLPAEALARATSLTDGSKPLSFVARLANLDLGSARDAARGLAAADILATDETVRFVHPLVRNAVYAAMPDDERSSLHRRVAELLREEDTDAEQIAAHLHSAGNLGEQWAAETLLTAAQSATERGAPRAAVLYLRHALAENPSGELRASILGQLGLAGVASGHPDAVHLVHEAASFAQSDLERVRYLIMAAAMLFMVGQYEQAISLCESLLEDTKDMPDARLEAVGLTAALQNVLGIFNEASIGQLSTFVDMIVSRPSAPETHGERLMLAARAGLGSLSGDLTAPEAEAIATRALDSIRGEDIRGPMMPAPMALWLADHFTAAERALDSGLDASRRRGYLHDFTSGLAHRAEVHYRTGRIREAIGDAEASLQGARQGIVGLEPVARAMLGVALLDSGDLERAGEALETKNISRWTGLTHLALLHEARGRLLLASGRSREASSSFHEAGEIVMKAGVANPAFCAWRSGAALAEYAHGNIDEARRLAAEETKLAKAFGAPRAIGIALRVEGLVTGGAHGASMLDEAVATLARSGAVLEYARALLDRGAARRRAGHVREAREDLRHALDVADSTGAYGVAARAREELVAAGGRPRRERLTGVASLTPQEHRIARMVADGLTNREIAESLFLTRKTIENHLTNVYAKLGISRREDLPRVLGESAALAPGTPASSA